jgi:hypothetical protein
MVDLLGLEFGYLGVELKLWMLYCIQALRNVVGVDGTSGTSGTLNVYVM